MIPVLLFFHILHPDRHQVAPRPFSPGVLIDQFPESAAVIRFDQMGKLMYNHIVPDELRHFGDAVGYPDCTSHRAAASVAPVLIGDPANGFPFQAAIEVPAIQHGRSTLEGLIVQPGELLTAFDTFLKIPDEGFKLFIGHMSWSQDFQYPAGFTRLNGLAPFTASVNADFHDQLMFQIKF